MNTLTVWRGEQRFLFISSGYLIRLSMVVDVQHACFFWFVIAAQLFALR